MIEVVFSGFQYCWSRVSMQVPAVGMISQQIDQVVTESEGEPSAIYLPDRIPSYLYNGANLSGPDCVVCTIFFFDGG